MFKYILAYHGAKMPDNPQEAANLMTKFIAWVESLGDAVIHPGTALGRSRIVSASGITEDAGTNRLTGYSIVKADSMETALEIAKSCPYLEIGTIEVAEVKEI
jgi:hypothetical protein